MRQVVRRQLFVAAVTTALLIATGVVAALAEPFPYRHVGGMVDPHDDGDADVA
jgi:hypothetical protein